MYVYNRFIIINLQMEKKKIHASSSHFVLKKKNSELRPGCIQLLNICRNNTQKEKILFSVYNHWLS